MTVKSYFVASNSIRVMNVEMTYMQLATYTEENVTCVVPVHVGFVIVSTPSRAANFKVETNPCCLT
jgi:hypothetical protein